MIELDGLSFLLKEATQVETTDEGTLKAIVGTLSVVDRHNDMIMPGAVGKQEVAFSAFGHRSWLDRAPIGKGLIYEEGQNIMYEGQFFMKMPEAASTFESIKGLDELQQYSWSLEEIKYSTEDSDESNDRGYIYKITKVKVREVSPVLRGASIGTRTVSIKEEGAKERGDQARLAELQLLRLKHISRTWGRLIS